MNDKLVLLIMRHLTLLDNGENASKYIFDAACKADIDLVHFEMANRDRVLKLIELFQSNIEEYLDKLEANEVNPDITNLVKSWANDLNLWVNRVDKIDLNTKQILEGQKIETTKEITSTYQGSETLKGYNLNNVTK